MGCEDWRERLYEAAATSALENPLMNVYIKCISREGGSVLVIISSSAGCCTSGGPQIQKGEGVGDE